MIGRRGKGLEVDDSFLFYVGRLLGASEMTAEWLALRPDAEAKALGSALASVAGWFLEPEARKRMPEAVTEVLPSRVGP